MRDNRKNRDIRAGTLRTPVYLGRPVITKGTAGGEVITWEELQTWASVEPVTGREWLAPVSIKDSVDVRITLRLTEGWKPDARWRVVDFETGAIYNIVTVMLLPALGTAECFAKTVAGNSDGR